MSKRSEEAAKEFYRGRNPYGEHPEYEWEDEGFIDGYGQAEKDLGWHSVEEFLPEIDEEVIVLKDNLGTAPIYEIAMAHIVDRNHCSDYNGWNIPGVRYWMPMPKMPEE